MIWVNANTLVWPRWQPHFPTVIFRGRRVPSQACISSNRYRLQAVGSLYFSFIFYYHRFPCDFLDAVVLQIGRRHKALKKPPKRLAAVLFHALLHILRARMLVLPVVIIALNNLIQFMLPPIAFELLQGQRGYTVGPNPIVIETQFFRWRVGCLTQSLTAIIAIPHLI